MHQGVVTANGIIDTAQLITDPIALQTRTSDDGLHLDNFHPGNFEWWYFDILDPQTDCILKIVAHLGTDPLRRKFFPQIAVSVKTPSIKKTFTHICQLDQLTAARDECNVKISEQFHCYFKKNEYHIQIDIPDFRGEFTLNCRLPGWKPLGDEVSIERGKRRAAFGWIIPAPSATVNGTFDFNYCKYNLKDAGGYHDHNFWKVGQTNKLFIDAVISKWYWGRFSAGDYTIIFMDTHLRKNQISSLYISVGEKVIHSSNNIANFNIDQQKRDKELHCLYPVKSYISTLNAPKPFNLILRTREVIDRKDLLEGVNPMLRFLINKLVSRPAYIGLETECEMTHAGQIISGTGILELMLFR